MTAWVDRLFPHLTESQRDGVRFLLVVLVLTGVGVGAWKGGAPWWRRYQHDQALAQAREFAQKNDPQNVLLALRRAIDFAPTNAATWREAATYLERFGVEESLFARQQVLQLAPDDWSSREAIFAAAVSAGRGEAARSALGGLSERDARGVQFHRLAAGVSLLEGNRAEALQHFGAWQALAPGDPDARFGRAMLLSEGGDPQAWQEARALLAKLTTDPTYRVRCAVQLLHETARRGPATEMEPLLRRLLEEFAPGETPDFTRPGNPAWLALLAGLQRAAGSAVNDVALMGLFLGQVGQGEEALVWLEALPESVRRAPRVMDVSAQLSALTDDLGRLETLLAEGAWGRWPAEARVLALAARTQAKWIGGEGGAATWNDAISATAEHEAGLRALYRLACIWNDPPAAARAVDAALRLTPRPGWAERVSPPRAQATKDAVHEGPR